MCLPEENYTTLATDSTPITYRVNPNVGFLSMFVCDRDARRAGELAAAWGEFGYGFRHFYTDGVHRPGKTSAIEEGRKIAALECSKGNALAICPSIGFVVTSGPFALTSRGPCRSIFSIARL